jgi:hypothetical protein
MKVIGLTGRARAGKDTVAGIIADELPGLRVVRQGFADKLKVSAALALGFEGEERELIATMDALKVCGSVVAKVEHGPDDVQESQLSGRHFLQRYGTEAHRNVFGEDFWLDAVLPTMTVGRGLTSKFREAFGDLFEAVVDAAAERLEVQGFRFGDSDEADQLTRDDGDVLVIPDVRFPNEAERIRDVGGTLWRVVRDVRPVYGHVSEAGIYDVDLVLMNDGTRADLRATVRAALADVGLIA